MASERERSYGTRSELDTISTSSLHGKRCCPDPVTRVVGQQESGSYLPTPFTAESTLKVLKRLWMDEHEKQLQEQGETSEGQLRGSQFIKTLSFEEVLRLATTPPKGPVLMNGLKSKAPPTCSPEASEANFPDRAVSGSKDRDLRQNHLIASSFSCSVCQDFFIDPALLNCGHTFCYYCILQWCVSSGRTCPVCRQVICNITQDITVRSFVDRLFENSPDEQNWRKNELERRDHLSRCPISGCRHSNRVSSGSPEIRAHQQVGALRVLNALQTAPHVQPLGLEDLNLRRSTRIVRRRQQEVDSPPESTGVRRSVRIERRRQEANSSRLDEPPQRQRRLRL